MVKFSLMHYTMRHGPMKSPNGRKPGELENLDGGSLT
jgi:hypothetical protein